MFIRCLYIGKFGNVCLVIFLFIFSVPCRGAFSTFYLVLSFFFYRKHFLVVPLPPINLFQPYSCSFPFFLFCFVSDFAIFLFFLTIPYICWLPTTVLLTLTYSFLWKESVVLCYLISSRLPEGSFFSSCSRISGVFV